MSSNIIPFLARLLNVIGSVIHHLRSLFSKIIILLDLSLQHLNVLFKSFNDFLTEMGPFSEFFFDLFVNVDISFKRLNCCLHFTVFEN